MPILNYSTEVDEQRSLGEIMGLLGSKGCNSIQVEYDGQGRPQGVSFIVNYRGLPYRFALPAKVEGVFEHIRTVRLTRHQRLERTMTQARRIAWRLMKDWVEVQLALVEAGQADMAEVFMPYMVNDKGQTLFSAWAAQKQLIEAS